MKEQKDDPDHERRWAPWLCGQDSYDSREEEVDDDEQAMQLASTAVPSSAPSVASPELMMPAARAAFVPSYSIDNSLHQQDTFLVRSLTSPK